MRPIELLEEIVGLNKWGNCNLSQILHLLGPTHYLSGKGKNQDTIFPYFHFANRTTTPWFLFSLSRELPPPP
jgi:hypothetical protein